MDLVLEQMHEQAVAPFGLHPRVAIDTHDAVQQRRRQRIADGDQALVGGGLSTLELCQRWIWNLVFPGFWPEPSTLQRVNVEQVDDVNMVQGLLQTGEETGPPGFELVLGEVRASNEQPVVRPGVVVGE